MILLQNLIKESSFVTRFIKPSLFDQYFSGCRYTLTNIFKLRSLAFQLWWICVSREAGGMSRSTSRRAGLEKSCASSRDTTDRVNVVLFPPPTPTPPPAPAPLSRLMLFTPPKKGRHNQHRAYSTTLTLGYTSKGDDAICASHQQQDL